MIGGKKLAWRFRKSIDHDYKNDMEILRNKGDPDSLASFEAQKMILLIYFLKKWCFGVKKQRLFGLKTGISIQNFFMQPPLLEERPTV